MTPLARYLSDETRNLNAISNGNT